MFTKEKLIAKLFERAGVTINGPRPWDIQVHSNDFYEQILKTGDLGLGETYVAGKWDCSRLDELFYRITKANIQSSLFKYPLFWRLMLRNIFMHLQGVMFNLQSLRKAKDVIDTHYNLDNNLYQNFLDSYMQYSCGYWHNANELNEAQLNKMELICQKISLQPGMKVLDIGCGWGGLAYYMAEKYNAEVYGITLSENQFIYAKELCKRLPVTIRLQDYRTLAKWRTTFDRVVSVGMFEHVGPKSYNLFMEIVRQRLKPTGLFLLHTIGGKTSTRRCGSLWIEKYIFPNGTIPSISQVSKAIEGKFVMEDWHNFGADYDRTLLGWYRNFCDHWPKLRKRYDNRFFRMWSYYLNSCAGTFRSRNLQLWQIVLSSQGGQGAYKRIGEKLLKSSN